MVKISSMATIKETNFYPSLDLYRGIAGYGVALSHFYFYLYDINAFEYLSIIMVEMFFILSGFVLAEQLLSVYKNKKNTKVFFYRRWIRTLPPYFLALIAYSLYFNIFDSDTIKYTFFIQHFFDGHLNQNYFPIAWSLAVEELFYLLFPIILVLFRSFRFSNIIIGFVFLIYLLKLIQILTGVDSEFYRIGSFLRLDAIAFGVLIAVLLKSKPNFFNPYLIYLCLLTSICILVTHGLDYLTLPYFITLVFMQTLSISLLLIFIDINKYIVNPHLIKIFSLLAKQTYSVYLFHFILIYFIKSLQWESSFYIFPLYVISLFSFSTLFYYFFEKEFIDRRPSYN